MRGDLRRLLEPNSVAIAGLSADPEKHGSRVLRALRTLGYPGEIWGVNPGRPEVEGVEVFTGISELPHQPDLVVAAVPSSAVLGLVSDCAGVGAVVVFAAGFAETDEQGKALQADVLLAADSAGTRLLGPNSAGVIRPGNGLAASFLTCLDRPAGEIRSGPVAVITQSGGTGSYLHNLAASQGEGLAVSVSTGNEADIEIGEAIEAVARIDEVRSIVVIIETIRDGRGFIEAVRAAHRRGKRVVACRIGNADAGRRLMASHTGALAVPAAVMTGVFDSLGVVVAETPGEAYEVATLLAHTPPAEGRRVGVVTHSGGVAILLADMAERSGLTLDTPGGALREMIEPHLDHGSIDNPVDLGAIIGDPSRFAAVVGAFSRSGDYDVVLAVSSPHPPAHSSPRARSLLDLSPGCPVLHLWLAGDQGAGGLSELRRAGAAVTEDPRAAVKALQALTTRPDPMPPPPPILGPPEEWEVPLHSGVVTSDSDEAVAAAESLGYPVVVKLEASAARHKTELGGVGLDIRDAEELKRTSVSILESAALAGIEEPRLRLQRFRPGLEVIVGALVDDVIGPLISVGVGGIFAEVLHDVVIAPAPITPGVAMAMIDRLKGRRLLDGYRGAAPADRIELARIVSQVSRGIAGSPVSEFEINPLIWDGMEWIAVDVLVS